MDKEEIKNVALAYTAKFSTAETREEFLNDYEANKLAFQKIEDSKPLPKAVVHKRSDYGF